MSPSTGPLPVAGSRTTAIERSPALGSEYEMGTRRVEHWNGPAEVTAPAASDEQGDHESGAGVGNDAGAVIGVVFGIVVPEIVVPGVLVAGPAVVGLPDVLRDVVAEELPGSVIVIEPQAVRATAPRAAANRAVGRRCGGDTRATLRPGSQPQTAPKLETAPKLRLRGGFSVCACG